MNLSTLFFTSQSTRYTNVSSFLNVFTMSEFASNLIEEVDRNNRYRIRMIQAQIMDQLISNNNVLPDITAVDNVDDVGVLNEDFGEFNLESLMEQVLYVIIVLLSTNKQNVNSNNSTIIDIDEAIKKLHLWKIARNLTDSYYQEGNIIL